MDGLPSHAKAERPPARALTRRQKAAVMVQLLVSGGIKLSLDRLPEDVQIALTREVGAMRMIDRATVQAVVDEFAGELDHLGLTFPGGTRAAISALDGHISPATAARLRRENGLPAGGDPWEQVVTQDPEVLKGVLERESIEVGAIILAKLPVKKAATTLGLLPGERARRITYAVSLTGAVTPAAVERIGRALAKQLDSRTEPAFDEGPVQRIGAILNSSQAATRDDVLEGLGETDAGFAEEVRRAIFTFANVATRVDPRDIPKVIRGLEAARLVTALAYGAARGGAEAVSSAFILDNISQRMADQLREEIAEAGKIKDADGEEAMGQLVAAIREAEAAGEIFLVSDEDE